jgi:hypothetical protein
MRHSLCGRRPRAQRAEGAAEADEERKLFWNVVEDSDDYLREIANYWLDNNLRSLLNDNNPAHRAEAKERKEPVEKKTTAEAKTKMQEHVKREARIILLSMITPNGKTLAQCTGEDCSRFGGWYLELAKAVPADTKVGDALSEDEVHKTWQQACK